MSPGYKRCDRHETTVTQRQGRVAPDIRIKRIVDHRGELGGESTSGFVGAAEIGMRHTGAPLKPG